MLTIPPINQRTKSTINFKALPKRVKILNEIIDGVSQQILIIPGGDGKRHKLKQGDPFFVFSYLPETIKNGLTKAYTDVKKAFFGGARWRNNGKWLEIEHSNNPRSSTMVWENDHIVTKEQAERLLKVHEFDYTYLKNLIKTDAIN